MMEDVNGLELSVGDKVVFTDFGVHGLIKGVVKGWNASLSMVNITYVSGPQGRTRTAIKSSQYISRVEDI